MKNTGKMFWKGSCFLAAVVGFSLMAFPASAGEPRVHSTKADKMSYDIGLSIVSNLKKQGGEFNLDLVIQGMKDGLTGETPRMSESDLLGTTAGLKMTRPQDQAANKRDDIKSDAVGKEIKDDEGAGQKQDSPEPSTDQAEQTNQLASQRFSGRAGYAGRADTSGMQQGGSAPNQQQNEQTAPLSQNGTVISKRNQAKLDVAELKREMRARVLSNEMPKSE